MTHLERVAIRRALETADFSRSPGLYNRMRQSLHHSYDRTLMMAAVFGLGIWILIAWTIFG